MTRLAVLVLTVLGLATPALAAPRKILVLPTDGTADPATRTKLTTQVARLAKGLDGQVATAGATFPDTALAVGCDPQAPGCSDQVLATLGVDELVWATATKDSGRTRVVVRRAARGAPPREISTTITPGDSPDHIDAGMAPLFTPSTTRPEPARSSGVPPAGSSGSSLPGAGSATGDQPGVPEVPADHHDRNLGIGFAAGGGAALVLGLALWASYGSLQSSIDNHPTANRSQFDDLKSLESRAATDALAGDCLVLVGLAAGGVGAYYLYRSYKQHRVAVTPAPMASGAGLVFTIRGGL